MADLPTNQKPEFKIWIDLSFLKNELNQKDTALYILIFFLLAFYSKEVCNGGVACSLLKLGSLEKTVIASLFHSGLHLSSPFFVEKTTLHDILPL